MIASIINVDKETVRPVLHDELNMKKVCAKMVPFSHSGSKRQQKKYLFQHIRTAK